MAKKNTDKSRVETVAEVKDGVSFVQKQYDNEGKLFCMDVFLPNMTMVSLNLVETKEFVSMMNETYWKGTLDELDLALETQEEDDDCCKSKNKKVKNDNKTI